MHKKELMEKASSASLFHSLSLYNKAEECSDLVSASINVPSPSCSLQE